MQNTGWATCTISDEIVKFYAFVEESWKQYGIRNLWKLKWILFNTKMRSYYLMLWEIGGLAVGVRRFETSDALSN